MPWHRLFPVWLCLCSAAFLGGCLSASDAKPALLVGDFAPIRVGNAWVYQRLHSHYADLFNTYKDSTRVEVRVEAILPAAGGDSVILAVHAVGVSIRRNDSWVFDTLAIDTLFRRSYLDTNGKLEGWNWDAATPNLFFRHRLGSNEKDRREYSPMNSVGPYDIAEARAVEGVWNKTRTWLLMGGRTLSFPDGKYSKSQSWTYAAGVGLVKSRFSETTYNCCSENDDQWALVSFTPAPP